MRNVFVILLLAGGMTLMGSPLSAKTHTVEMTAVEKDVVIDGEGTAYAAWTFNGQFPGPVVRVTEGDTVKFKLINPAENKHPHAMDFHAAEIDFLKNYRAINAGETIEYTFVARKPGIFYYHCGAPPMIQHVARGMFGAIIVDPKNPKAWPKADREYVLIQSELFKNPDDVQAMFDRKFDNVIFNGGIFKYHPFVTGGGKLEALRQELVTLHLTEAPEGIEEAEPSCCQRRRLARGASVIARARRAAAQPVGQRPAAHLYVRHPGRDHRDREPATHAPRSRHRFHRRHHGRGVGRETDEGTASLGDPLQRADASRP